MFSGCFKPNLEKRGLNLWSLSTRLRYTSTSPRTYVVATFFHLMRLVLKANLRIELFAVAILFMVMSNAHAVQVNYKIEQRGISGDLNFSETSPDFIDDTIETDISKYRVTGSVKPDRVGLIGVRTGFTAAVAKELEGFTSDGGGLPEGGQDSDENTSDTGGGEMFGWDRVSIATSAVGSFTTRADINGLDDYKGVGFVRFDWVIDGISSIFVDADQGFGDFEVTDAITIAKLDSGVDIFDSFAHAPTPGPDDSISDSEPAVLQQESFLLRYDTNQLASGEVPQLDVDFEFTVESRLNVTNTEGGAFVGIFDADFSNTATLSNVTVLGSDGVTVIETASVVDSFTGQSLVASSVPEPSTLVMLVLAGCAGTIRRRRR